MRLMVLSSQKVVRSFGLLCWMYSGGLVLVVGLTIDSQVTHERLWLTPAMKLLVAIL